MRFLIVATLLASSLAAPAFSAEARTADYTFIEPAEPLPRKPWHDHFVDGSAKTPEGLPNAGAAWCDSFLDRALKGQLKRSAAQSHWQDWGMFLHCAMWGYLSPDSRFEDDERLIDMSRTWLDHLFERLVTKPDRPKAAKKWKPNRLGTWSFHHYSMPLLEIEARPELKAKLGTDRIAKFRDTVLANIELNTTPQAYNELMEKSETYINMITHPMAVYIHGWLLTGERNYLRMSHRIVHTLGRDQLPNGMFPYRYRIHGDRHCEYEAMYYHAINIRGLYLYWWATGSKLAERIFRKAIPYYPLNLEPPYFFNDGADIWWKDQWRTFWPHHIAMVAAATGDGENATLANAMARGNVSHDRFDLVLGAHAYQQMGIKGLTEKPLRTDYIIEDPDIRGVRLRFGTWSSTFTAGSFTYTRTSAMKVSEDGKSFTALHMARPYVRVAPLQKAFRTEADYGTLPARGAEFAAAIAERAAAVATSYRPALTARTWDKVQPLAPWQMNELWLVTDRGLVGVIDSLALEDNPARELCHMFRFIPRAKAEAGKLTGDSTAECGDLRFRVWRTDLPFVIEERTRRYALSSKDRRDWQICLTDTDRAPEQIAQDPAGPERSELLLPQTRDYAEGYRRTSLVEVSPTADPGFEDARFTRRGEVLTVHARIADNSYTAIFNAGTSPLTHELAGPARRVVVSWGKDDDAPGKDSGNRTRFHIPPGGTLLILR